MPTGAPIIALSDVQFAWSGGRDFGLTIDTFAVEARERVLLAGPSGSGKSTLLALLAGIIVPGSGAVQVAGVRLEQMSSPARDRFRAAHLGVIFQQFNLLPYLSVRDNVLLPLRLSAERRRRVSDPAGEADRLLRALGLDETGLGAQKAATLSTGQQQRVAAARALIGGPSLIVADEPTSALDRDRQDDFLRLLFAEAEQHGTTIIMVSHDESLAAHFTRMVRLPEIARFNRAEAG